MEDGEVVGRPTAGAVRRGLALAVDLVVISTGALLISTLLPRAVRLSTHDVPAFTTSSWAFWSQTAVVVAWSCTYVVACWTRRGATVGDTLIRLRRTGHAGDAVTTRAAVLGWLSVLALPSVATTVGALAPLAGGVVWLSVAVWYLVLAVSCRWSRVPGLLHDRWTGIVTVRRAPTTAPAGVAGRPPRAATT